MTAKPAPKAVLRAPIAERIARAFPQLSDAHRRAAAFVLERPIDAATMTIDELAGAASVSTATANRFVRAIGFDGYAEFRAELVEALKSSLAPEDKLRLRRPALSDAAGLVADSLHEDMRNLQQTLDALSGDAAARAVAMLLAARTIYTVGFGTSTYLAAFAANALEPLCARVCFASVEGGAEMAVRRLVKLGPEDLVLAISFPRYSRDALAMLRLARERGAATLAITDGPTSPLASEAQLTLYAFAERRVLSSSAVAGLAVIEALVTAVVCGRDGASRILSELTEQVRPYIVSGPADR